MSDTVDKVIIYAVLIPETIAVLVGGFRYNKLRPPLQSLWILALSGLLTDVVSRVLILLKVSNLFLITLYIPVEFALLALIYRYELKGSKIAAIIPYLISGFAILFLYKILSGNIAGFNKAERFAEGFFVLLLVLQYLYQTLKKLDTYRLEHTPMFWLSAGLFIYFPCDIIIFTFSDYILSSYSHKFSLQLWNIHAILTMILYIFYTLALWIDPKN